MCCHVLPLHSQNNGLFMVLQTSSSGSAEAEAGAGVLIQGLKHKLLVYLLKKKQQEVADGNREALKQFHYVFENYVNLLMWKVSLILCALDKMMYVGRIVPSLDFTSERQGLQLHPWLGFQMGLCTCKWQYTTIWTLSVVCLSELSRSIY